MMQELWCYGTLSVYPHPSDVMSIHKYWGTKLLVHLNISFQMYSAFHSNVSALFKRKHFSFLFIRKNLLSTLAISKHVAHN